MRQSAEGAGWGHPSPSPDAPPHTPECGGGWLGAPQPVPRRPAAHARVRRGLAGGTPARPPTPRRTRQSAEGAGWGHPSPSPDTPHGGLVYTLGTLNPPWSTHLVHSTPPGLHTWYTQPPLVYTLGTLNPPWSTHLVHSTPPGLHTWYTQPPLVYTLGTLNPPWSTHLVHSTPPGLHTWYTQPPLVYTLGTLNPPWSTHLVHSTSDSFSITIFCWEIIIAAGNIFKKSVYECKETSLIPGRGRAICQTEHLGPLGSQFFFFRILCYEEYWRKVFKNLKKLVKYHHGKRRAHFAKCKCVICESENFGPLGLLFLFRNHYCGEEFLRKCLHINKQRSWIPWRTTRRLFHKIQICNLRNRALRTSWLFRTHCGEEYQEKRLTTLCNIIQRCSVGQTNTRHIGLPKKWREAKRPLRRTNFSPVLQFPLTSLPFLFLFEESLRFSSLRDSLCSFAIL